MTIPAEEFVRILIVEDNQIDAKLVRFALEGVPEWRVRFDVVEDGEDAIAYLHQQGNFQRVPHPDLVVLDLNLPKRNGTEVLQFIRSREPLRRLPVIVLSSSPMDVIRDQVRESEVQPDCCFTKPVGLDEFLALGASMRQCYLRAGQNAAGQGSV